MSRRSTVLASAIREKFEELYAPRVTDGAEPVLCLLESDGKLPNGDKIVPAPGRDSWEAVMFHPSQDLTRWAHEAMVLVNHMSPEELTKRVNERGGYHLNGNGPWAGMSALHWAVGAGYPCLVGALLEIQGVDVNIRDALGRTPLQLAFTGRSYNVKVVTALIEHEADFGVEDYRGDTPLHTVILFHDDPDWLPLMIIDHLIGYDYSRKDAGGRNLLERVQTWTTDGKRGTIVEKIKSAMRSAPAQPGH